MTKYAISKKAAALACLSLGLLGWLTFYGFKVEQFTPDSWFFYELSKHIFDDFFRVNTFRHFFFHVPYSKAFPPLFPILIGAVNHLYDLKIFAGIVLNFVEMGLVFFIVYFLAKRMTSQKMPTAGIASFLCLLSASAFIEEYQAGRGVILNVMLFAAIMSLYVNRNMASVQRYFFLGLFAGLAALNRFDFVASCFVLGALLIYFERSKQIWLFIVGALLGMLPWIIYSEIHFSTIWAIDHKSFAALAIPHYYQDFFPADTVFKTMWTNPEDWVMLKLSHFGQGFKSLLVLRSAIIPFAYMLFMLRQCRKQGVAISLDDSSTRLLQLSLIFAPHVFSVMFAGYYQPRYLILELLYACFLFTILGERFRFLLMQRSSRHPPVLNRFSPPERTIVAASFALCFCSFLYRFHFSEYNYDAQLPFRGAGLTASEENLQRVVLSLPPEKQRVLNLGNAVYSERFSTVTGIVTYLEPSNINHDNYLWSFVKEWQVPVISTNTPERLDPLRNDFAITELAANIYLITPK